MILRIRLDPTALTSGKSKSVRGSQVYAAQHESEFRLRLDEFVSSQSSLLVKSMIDIERTTVSRRCIAYTLVAVYNRVRFAEGVEFDTP